MCRATWLRLNLTIVAVAILSIAGCTSSARVCEERFQMGPNVGVPAGSTSPHWIDSADIRVREDLGRSGPLVDGFEDSCNADRLVADACNQNLSLREASFRVLESRAQLGIAQGNIFPNRRAWAADT